VEVAHEALIRYWPTLQNWLNQNRNDLLLRETINQAAQEWQQHQEQAGQDTYLIHQGGRLEDAEVLWKHPKFVHLNQEEAEYVLACVQLRQRRLKLEEQRRKRQLMAAVSAAFVLGGFAIVAGSKWRQSEIQQIQAFLESAEASLASNQTLDARIRSLQAGKAFKQSFWQRWLPDAGLRNQVLGKLSQTIYAGQELNRLEIDQNSLPDGVRSIAFTPAGRLALADYKDSVRLWNSQTQKLEESIKQTSGNKADDQKHGTTNEKISPDGQLLVVSERDGKLNSSVYLWDTKTKKRDKLETSDSLPLLGAAFSPDSKFLSAWSTSYAYLWDTKTKKLKHSRRNQDGESAKFSPDDQFLLIHRYDDHTVYLENIRTKERYSLPDKFSSNDKAKVYGLVLSPDSQLLAVIDQDRQSIYLWNTKTKKRSEEFDKWFYVEESPDLELDRVEFIPDSQLLLIRWANGTIWLRDIKGRWLTKLQGQNNFGSVAFRQTDQLLVTTDDRAVRLWDISEGRLKVMRAKDSIDNIAFSSDGQRLATVSKDTAYLGDTESKNLRLLQGQKGKVKRVAFTPDGQILIATTTDDGIVWLWDDQGNKQSLKLQGYQGKLQEVVFSPNGQHLAVRSTNDKGRTISVWLGDTKGQQLVKLQEDQEQISAINKIEAISPDGQILAVRSNKDPGNSVWLADTKDQQLLKLQADGGITTIAFSPDSQSLVTGRWDNTIELWDTKGQPKPMDKTAKHKGGLSSVAFSPDGQFLASGGGDGTTQLWTIKGQKLAILPGHQGHVDSLAFSANGKLLATAGWDGTARLWKIGGLDELLAMNCDWVRDYLKNPSADDLSESERHLCDGIPRASSSPKK
jgi:WD40 repeat protein